MPSPLEGKTIAECLPPWIEFREVALSFTLPKGKDLSRNTNRALRTEFDSSICLRVEPDCLKIICTPPLLIDAQWPAKNLQFNGAAIQFAGALVEVFVCSIHGVGEGMIDVTAIAEKEIRDLVNTAIAETAMARGGYDPTCDPDVMATLVAIRKNFDNSPPGGVSDVSPKDIQIVAVEATVAARTAFTHSQESGAVELPAGGTLKLRITGAGNLASLLPASSVQYAIQAANIQGITLTSNALTLHYGGQPVTVLERVQVDRGGNVKIEKMRLKGSLEDAADMESLVRVLAGAAALSGQGYSAEESLRLAASAPNAQAELVPGLTRMKIEKIMTEAIQQLVRDSAGAIPGIDLQQILMA